MNTLIQSLKLRDFDSVHFILSSELPKNFLLAQNEEGHTALLTCILLYDTDVENYTKIAIRLIELDPTPQHLQICTGPPANTFAFPQALMMRAYEIANRILDADIHARNYFYYLNDVSNNVFILIFSKVDTFEGNRLANRLLDLNPPIEALCHINVKGLSAFHLMLKRTKYRMTPLLVRILCAYPTSKLTSHLKWVIGTAKNDILPTLRNIHLIELKWSLLMSLVKKEQNESLENKDNWLLLWFRLPFLLRHDIIWYGAQIDFASINLTVKKDQYMKNLKTKSERWVTGNNFIASQVCNDINHYNRKVFVHCV